MACTLHLPEPAQLPRTPENIALVVSTHVVDGQEEFLYRVDDMACWLAYYARQLQHAFGAAEQ